MSKRRTIAQAAMELLNREGIKTLSWGDGILHEIADLAGLKQGVHPLDDMIRVLNGLERSQYFEKGMLRAHDCSGRPRNVRCFWLKDEFFKPAEDPETHFTRTDLTSLS